MVGLLGIHGKSGRKGASVFIFAQFKHSTASRV
jgi:hypothetical protein